MNPKSELVLVTLRVCEVAPFTPTLKFIATGFATNMAVLLTNRATGIVPGCSAAPCRSSVDAGDRDRARTGRARSDAARSHRDREIASLFDHRRRYAGDSHDVRKPRSASWKPSPRK